MPLELPRFITNVLNHEVTSSPMMVAATVGALISLFHIQQLFKPLVCQKRFISFEHPQIEIADVLTQLHVFAMGIDQLYVAVPYVFNKSA